VSRLIAALIALLLAALPARAEPRIVTDLSERIVRIEYRFAGADLLLFGAIQGLPPGARPDVIVVVRGPNEPVTVRFKERVAGVWVNTQAVRFETAPGFYAIAATRPIDDIASPRWRAVHELGVANLHFSPSAGQSAEEFARFRDGFIDLRRRLGLFAEQIGGVELVENALFRTRISLPARVPVGDFQVRVFLLSKGEVVAVTDVPLSVTKTGFERRVFDAAQNSPFFYGVAAVLIALGAGWLASRVIRR
jgi:uncharacterized protein (TIGR02186 family)